MYGATAATASVGSVAKERVVARSGIVRRATRAVGGIADVIGAWVVVVAGHG